MMASQTSSSPHIETLLIKSQQGEICWQTQSADIGATDRTCLGVLAIMLHGVCSIVSCRLITQQKIKTLHGELL
jgi:hypothetical protein